MLNLTKVGRRFFSFSRSAYSKKVAVIGAGPSGFYTSLNLLKDKDPALQIDMFEKNPCPFGLVRYGVAPDHPEVKNCQERFQDTRNDRRFQYFGNVSVGSDIKLKELYDNYDVVVYSYGSSLENKLGIPGEDDHPAIINSRAFVGWYNGDPDYRDLDPPLDKVDSVIIIGNGNVAIDIARILMAPVDSHWKTTDITEHALRILKKSTVEKVTIVARRGFLESKFTNKEFKELLELHNEGVYFGGWPEEKFSSLKDLKLGRVDKRRLSLVNKYKSVIDEEAKDAETGKVKKVWYLDYLKSPIGFKVDSNDPSLLEEVIFRDNAITIQHDPDTGKYKSTITPTDGFSSIVCQMVIPSIGYKCEPMEEFEELGIPFDTGRGIIPNVDGKVEGRDDSFCVGWIANGSRGNINSTVMTSSLLAGIIQDQLKVVADGTDKPGRTSTESLLENRKVRVVNWDDWVKISEYERSQGEPKGKPGEKVTDYGEMLKICK
ncbi:DEKNAAC104725 [Brettanomyces naardenensis]|uniref:NADPH:adrenodoxin oxidoreductase, mitochondrial n=1 Tax=Brettanomyces naardenensis TaxID=13370 RepID=A0A448YRR0_BRENA|nr:DEKNAAC104725 [Brettanomyces naardenensis]